MLVSPTGSDGDAPLAPGNRSRRFPVANATGPLPLRGSSGRYPHPTLPTSYGRAGIGAVPSSDARRLQAGRRVFLAIAFLDILLTDV